MIISHLAIMVPFCFRLWWTVFYGTQAHIHHVGLYLPRKEHQADSLG